MPKFDRNNIDRKTNIPNNNESVNPYIPLNRSEQTRRDNDVIRTPKRTLYDVDFAIKWYLDNEIQPQIIHSDQVLDVPVIFTDGEKWNNVRQFGFLRDEKGMLQSPLIMIKRNSFVERDTLKTLDVNIMPDANRIATLGNRYNSKNTYKDELFPMPDNDQADRQQIYLIDIPKYVTVEYELFLWCDFTSQLNDVIDQILPYNRYAWGTDRNLFPTGIGSVTFETTNTTGEDRLVRATIPLTVQATLLSGQESRISTLKKAFSIKKVSFDTIIDLPDDLFASTTIPPKLAQVSQQVLSGANILVTQPSSGPVQLTPISLTYIITLRDEVATYLNSTTVILNVAAGFNPITSATATVNEFDLYINGQYIAKQYYTWTPSSAASQSIVFDIAQLGYDINSTDVVIINGRWA